MRITQGYVSKSVMDFSFHQAYSLDDYKDENHAAVFFGMYRYEDYRLFSDNKNAYSKIFWCGQDAFTFNRWNQLASNNVTPLPKVAELIINEGLECQLLQPSTIGLKPNSQRLGKSIYAYCPSSSSNYHGKKIIDELRCAGYEILIGDGQFTQSEWRNGRADFYYSQCFIGLCLSDFAGGSGSIIEMGLRGMRVVTNVLKLPNCDAWNSIHDVMTAIENQTQFIGQTNTKLSQQVWDDLDHKHQWLNV